MLSAHKRANVAELIQICDVMDNASRNTKARTCARASELELLPRSRSVFVDCIRQAVTHAGTHKYRVAFQPTTAIPVGRVQALYSFEDAAKSAIQSSPAGRGGGWALPENLHKNAYMLHAACVSSYAIGSVKI